MNDFSHLNNVEVLKSIRFRLSVLFPSMIMKNQVNLYCFMSGMKNIIDHEINPIFHWNRHQYMVFQILQQIENEKLPKIVSLEQNNLHEDIVRPDLEFQVNVYKYYIDIVYSRDDGVKTAFDRKVQKYSNA